MMDDEKSAADPALAEAGEVPSGGDGHHPPPGQPADSGDASRPEAGTTRDTPPKPKAKRRGSFLRELPILIVIALALALLIKTYAFQAYFIPSSSMENTLDVGDKVLVNKIVYHLRPIHRGDIIVFNGAGSWNTGPVPSPSIFDRFYHAVIGLFGARPGETDYIKRVIGVPGDVVACCNAQGDVTVNGVALHEKSYLYPGNVPSATKFGPLTVPPGRLWVMGDHRQVSDDSRGHTGYPGGGTIPENEVVGRAFWIVWPPSRWRVLPIPQTFEQPALTSHKAAAAGQQAGSGLLSAPVVPAGSALPLAAGFAGALPLTWGQRRLRGRIRRRLARRQ